MATANTIFKDILCVKGIVVEKYETYTDSNQVVHLRIRARVAANERNRCPVCGRKCKGYDVPHNRKVWRALDCGGLVTEIASENHRIECPEHGVLQGQKGMDRNAILKDFVNAIIERITVKDGRVTSIEFKNGQIHSFIYPQT